MLKKTYSNIVALATVCMLGLLAGCKEAGPVTDVEPAMDFSIVETGSTYVDIVLNTSNISSYAYSVQLSGEAVEPELDVLFASENVGSCVDGENTFTVKGLEPLTEYTIYIAGITSSDEYYEDLLTASFSTTDYTDYLTLVQTYYDGFRMHVRVPESVAEAGNGLRFTHACLPMHIYNKQWGTTDADMLIYNSGMYTVNDTTLIVNDETNYFVDEWGQESIYHYPYVPGEPIVFTIGEFAWADDPWYGSGYIDPLFDYTSYEDAVWDAGWDYTAVDETIYWTGYYDQMVFTISDPLPLAATVNVDISTAATDATIYLTPEEGVAKYSVLIVDDASYDMVLTLLDGNTDYLQWFVTSYYAYLSFGTETFTGNYQLSLKEYFYTVNAESHYHVLVTAMGDEAGTTQSFQHIEFDTAAKTLEAPEITVTAIDNPYGDNSPFEVWFNVRKTGGPDIVSAVYACNYDREWASELLYSTYAEIVAYGYSFDDSEVAQINSADGLNVSFSSLEGMTTRLAVLGYNEEDTPNEIVDENSLAVADAVTGYLPDADRVESSLFDELPGTWTMTAEASNYSYSDGGYVSLGELTKGVNIYGALNDYPDVLPEEVYGYYTGMSREEVDRLYDEFKTEAAAYNARLRGQNRLLCIGFGFESSSSYYPAFTAATPYDLFCSTSYSAYNVAALFYDFGPKWYLEISDSGVSVPVNTSRLYPLSSWTTSYTYHLVALTGSGSFISYDSAGENIYFPVSVTDSDNFSVEPYTYDGSDYYPNAIYYYYGSYASLAGYRVDTALSMSRSSSGSSAAATSLSSSPESGEQPRYSPVFNTSSETLAAPKSRTSFLGKKHYQKAEMTPVSAEQAKENIKNYLEKAKK